MIVHNQINSQKVFGMFKLKNIFILLVLFTIAFSSAPTWVVVGTNLNYSTTSNNLSFTVQNVSISQIKTQLKTYSTGGALVSTAVPNENASAMSGQFWFDPYFLQTAFVGGSIGAFSVTDQGKQTFAGKEWDTVTLEDTEGGATVRRVYDKSGLLLKETVSVPTFSVILTQYNIPSIGNSNPAPPPPAPPPQPKNNSAPAPPPPNVAPNPSPNPAPDNSQNQSNVTPAPKPKIPSKLTPKAPAKPLLPCCPATFVLLIVTFVAFKIKN